jgi:hypothetical protein
VLYDGDVGHKPTSRLSLKIAILARLTLTGCPTTSADSFKRVRMTSLPSKM